MSKIKGLFFDQDGVIIESERDGHRVSFNRTFKEFGYPFEWDVDEYGELLKISGGKERMKHYFLANKIETNQEKLDQLVIDMHAYKTKDFVRLIEDGIIPLRSGIKRIMSEAKEKGLIVGICTTSNKKAAEAVTHVLLDGIDLDFLLAGDIVKHKKPDPEIYNLALEVSKLSPDECVVIEDTRNGLLSAKRADLQTIITTSFYSTEEDFTEADLVVDCMGDVNVEECHVIASKKDLVLEGILTIDDILAYFD